jgi:hypothetical protein
MTVRVGLEVDTLTIRIPIRLQRRGRCKLETSIYRFSARARG